MKWHVRHGLSAFAYLGQASGYFRRLEQNTLDKVPPDARSEFSLITRKIAIASNACATSR